MLLSNRFKEPLLRIIHSLVDMGNAAKYAYLETLKTRYRQFVKLGHTCSFFIIGIQLSAAFFCQSSSIFSDFYTTPTGTSTYRKLDSTLTDIIELTKLGNIQARYLAIPAKSSPTMFGT